MKKRILSMLLLVALLVTAIPVMAISATDTDYTNDDYAELYAKQDNLVHLYMAFNNGDAADYYDLSTGKWFDMVGEVDATFTDDSTTGAKWTADANGGISPISTLVPDEVWELYAQVGGNVYLDGAWRSTGGHTVFGHVYQGMDVVDAIAAVAVDDNDKPTSAVTITTIEIITYQG